MSKPFDTESSKKAQEVTEEQKKKYRATYQDDEYWRELAKGYGLRMPPYYARPSDQEIKHWLKVAKVSYTQFVESFGWKNSEEFERMNPTHGMKILAGLILELGEENKRLKKLAGERCEEFDVQLGLTVPRPLRLYKGQSKTTRRLVEAI